MAGFRRDRGSMSRAAKRKQQERDKLDATPPWQHPRHGDESATTTGPYDVKDTPDDDHERVDLGALRLPVVKGIDIQAEADNEGRVSTVRLVRKGTQMQVGVFAAPRAEGIWDEIRAEIAESMAQGGGSAEEHEGDRFGTELRGELAGARGAKTPVRFLGVDGPRWFVRAMVVGPGATDDEAAEPLLEVFADTVVVRGRDPLPVREPVPLHLPKTDAVTGDDSDDDS
ncbi:DUF3710 domain-containing protein [Jatrophihabitans sp. YIM 134969]